MLPLQLYVTKTVIDIKIRIQTRLVTDKPTSGSDAILWHYTGAMAQLRKAQPHSTTNSFGHAGAPVAICPTQTNLQHEVK